MNLLFFAKIIGYFASYSMGAFFSLPLHLITFSSSFSKFRSFSNCLSLLIFVTSCCINTNHKCSALLYSLVVTYLCTTFSSWFKLFCKLLVNLRINAVIFKNCKSILSLHLGGHNSLEHSSPRANKQNLDDPSAWSTKPLFWPTLSNWNLVH